MSEINVNTQEVMDEVVENCEPTFFEKVFTEENGKKVLIALGTIEAIKLGVHAGNALVQKVIVPTIKKVDAKIKEKKAAKAEATPVETEVINQTEATA